MTGLLQRIYRRAFWPSAKRELFERFENDPTLEAVILFEWIAPYPGIGHCAEWLKHADRIHIRSTRRDYRVESSDVLRDEEETKEVFDELFEELNGIDKRELDQQTQPLKDGTTLSIAWGNRESIKTLFFQHPIDGSELQRLGDRLLGRRK
jgi:hypothetical protein